MNFKSSAAIYYANEPCTHKFQDRCHNQRPANLHGQRAKFEKFFQQVGSFWGLSTMQMSRSIKPIIVCLFCRNFPFYLANERQVFRELHFEIGVWSRPEKNFQWNGPCTETICKSTRLISVDSTTKKKAISSDDYATFMLQMINEFDSIKIHRNQFLEKNKQVFQVYGTKIVCGPINLWPLVALKKGEKGKKGGKLEFSRKITLCPVEVDPGENSLRTIKITTFFSLLLLLRGGQR